MKVSQFTLLFVFTMISGFAFAQQELLKTPISTDLSCEINFVPTTSIADLEFFAKCYVYKTPEVNVQSTIMNDQINFKQLPLLVPQHEFPTQQNVYRQTFFLGAFDQDFANAKTNNVAFFEANRNSVMGTAFYNFTPDPIF
ncbi:MAG: hypothetical protein ABF274_01495 [Nonlabens sp.]|uniref:hypothetical protein n=1 Tax=Nonlabens sp. TaxID=1888209 RepID=UPI00321A9923